MKPLEDSIVTTWTDDQARAAIRQIKARFAKASKVKLREAAPSSTDPREELTRLVKLHWTLTQNSVRLTNGACDKTIQSGPDKGTIIPCRLPADQQRDQLSLAEQNAAQAKAYEGPIEKQLETFEVWRSFLVHVFGCGPVTGGYLLANIDIRREGLKPSGVRRYCGYAVIDGKADRACHREGWLPAQVCKDRKPFAIQKPREADKIRGVNGHEEWLVSLPMAYNAMIKMRLWQMMSAMQRNAAKCTNDAPYGVTNKYLDRWYEAKRAALTVQGMKAGKAQSKGMRKAIDLFLLDLYTVWRAIEGLPIWPSYYEAQRGYMHGGSPAEQGPRTFTTTAALQFVGDFRTRPLQHERKWGADVMMGDGNDRNLASDA